MKASSPLDRFWNHVAMPEDQDSCWIWTGTKDWAGYGRLSLTGAGGRSTSTPAHRFSYEISARQAIPPGLVIDHLCRNPGCVNPGHLEVVTSGENTLRGVSFTAINAAKQFCKNGHELTGANIYRVPKGRHCKRCIVLNRRRWRERGRKQPKKTREGGQCIRGHELSGLNLVMLPTQERVCRACANDRLKRWRQHRKEAGRVDQK